MNEQELTKIVESVVQSISQRENGASVYADVTLDMAKKLIEAVEQKAAQMGVHAVIAVANRGANPVQRILQRPRGPGVVTAVLSSGKRGIGACRSELYTGDAY